MPIRRLAISEVRNIRHAKLDDLGPINILYGKNGSGKTSVLEAINLLGLGKSFRSSKLKPVINNESEACTVFGSVAAPEGGAPIAIGVQRSKGGQSANKIQGVLVRSSAELAERLPLQLLNSDSFDLLVGGPKLRRRFLDGGVFHVEHQFHALWLHAQRSLKQRNSLLRRAKIDIKQLASWTNEFVNSSEVLHQSRAAYFEMYRPVFLEMLADLFDLKGITLDYHCGWDARRTLDDVLTDALEIDQKQGYTHSGPHRADIRVKIDGVAVADILSRGQQKMVVAALKLAQAKLLTEKTGKTSVFLLDDLPAELDREYRTSVCRVLTATAEQVFVTCVDPNDLQGCWQQSAVVKMFHVEHGEITAD